MTQNLPSRSFCVCVFVFHFFYFSCHIVAHDRVSSITVRGAFYLQVIVLFEAAARWQQGGCIVVFKTQVPIQSEGSEVTHAV